MSWLTLLLARTGVNIEVFDFDSIEHHNIGGQWYSKKNIGKTKVEALQGNVEDFADISIFASNEKVTDKTLINSFAFSAFDNMNARKDMFKAWKEQNKDNPDAIFIDGRLAAEQWEVYCIRNTPGDIAFYEDPSILFEDSEVEDAPCTMKQTSHFAAMIASYMTTYFTNHLTNVEEKEIQRKVPIKTTYIGQLNRFKTEYLSE